MEYVYRDTPVGFHRLNKIPLDDREVFNSITDLFSYINNGAAYDGQRAIIKFKYYDQNITLKTGRGTKLMPIIEPFSGFEPIVKKVNNNSYIMIYYYNGGEPFTKIEEQVRTTDAYAWALLPQASLFAGNDNAINYLLEYANEENEQSFSFTQANFATNTVALGTGSTINRISSTSDSVSFFTTNNSNIHLMPKSSENNIVRLWVKCDDYLNALGVT